MSEAEEKTEGRILPQVCRPNRSTANFLCCLDDISAHYSTQVTSGTTGKHEGDYSCYLRNPRRKRAACNSCEYFCCKATFMASMSVAPIAELSCSETCPMSVQQIAGRESWGHTFALNTSPPVSSNRHLFNARRNRRSNWLTLGIAHLLGFPQGDCLRQALRKHFNLNGGETVCITRDCTRRLQAVQKLRGLYWLRSGREAECWC